MKTKFFNAIFPFCSGPACVHRHCTNSLLILCILLVSSSFVFDSVRCNEQDGYNWTRNNDKSIPKLFASQMVSFGGGRARLLHFAPSEIFTPSQFDFFGFGGMKVLFEECFGFNLSREYSDYEVVSNFIHGRAFDAFVLVDEDESSSLINYSIGPKKDAPARRKTRGTLSLCHRKMSDSTDLVSVYNLCLDATLRGGGKGREFMEVALEMLYKRIGIVPSVEHPVMLALSLIISSPTFVPACRSYLKQGFYHYDYGNVANMTDLRLIEKMNVIRREGRDSFLSIVSRDFDADHKRSKRRLFSNKKENSVFGLFKLDTGSVTFALPPNDFCLAIKAHMENGNSLFTDDPDNSPQSSFTDQTTDDVGWHEEEDNITSDDDYHVQRKFTNRPSFRFDEQ